MSVIDSPEFDKAALKRWSDHYTEFLVASKATANATNATAENATVANETASNATAANATNATTANETAANATAANATNATTANETAANATAENATANETNTTRAENAIDVISNITNETREAITNATNETREVIANATNATEGEIANATNETREVIANVTNATEGEIANATNASSENATIAYNETNATGAANATAGNETNNLVLTFWLPEYDNDNMTKEMIIADMAARGVYGDFLLWYDKYYGTNGLAVEYFRSANQSNASSNATNEVLGASTFVLLGGESAIPAGLEAIVNWIKQMAEKKVLELNLPAFVNTTMSLGGL